MLDHPQLTPAVLDNSLWQDCLTQLRLWQKDSHACQQWFERLQVAYAEPQRHYHTAAHINACLTWVDTLENQLAHPNWVRIVCYFHDVIYQPTRQDNEMQSAALATACLTSLNAAADMMRWVEHSILATNTHDMSHEISHDMSHAKDNDDMRYFMDIDISILGTEPDVYAAYQRAIRQEYQHVDDASYRQGRAEVLHHFIERLQRHGLYQTPYFAKRLHHQAQRNVQHELDSL